MIISLVCVCDRVCRDDTPLTVANGESLALLHFFRVLRTHSAVDLDAGRPPRPLFCFAKVDNDDDRPSLRMRTFHTGTGSRQVYDQTCYYILTIRTNGRRQRPIGQNRGLAAVELLLVIHNKKLSCRKEAARYFVSLNISPSQGHSK